ncbi:MAG: nucleotidyltransferase family protein [Nanoarchaeota archaeon]
MAYTEIKERNGKKYYYRALSVREGNRIKKKRIYLGADLPLNNLEKKEREADKLILNEKIERNLGEISKKIIKVLKKYGVEKAGIFGSYACGENKKNSDIDILITHPRSPKARGFGFVIIENDLEETLKRKVDLVTYNSLSPYLREKILREAIRII